MKREGLGAGFPSALLLSVLMLLAPAGGCRSTTAVLSTSEEQLSAAIRELTRPLPGPMAALYRLQVGSTRTLRLALLADGGWGRMTISESFGSTLSIGAWDEAEGSRILDMREGCRLRTTGLSGELGLGEIPIRRIPLLLGGRIPLEEDDHLDLGRDPGEILIRSAHWQALIRLVPDPWRVCEIRSGDFVVKLSDHSLSVPGRIETRDDSGRLIRLDLLRLRWEIRRKPGKLPEFPLCTADSRLDEGRKD